MTKGEPSMNSPREALAFGFKRFFQVLFCCLAALFLVRVVLVPSTAQSTGERELEDRIPKHLPIKVKIKKEKEKAFKDLKNEKWLTDFELEITNTGDKPIYFLAILLEMPELVSESGRQLAYPLIYGRKELADLTSQVREDDIPLGPGESYRFKIQEKWAKGMQQMRARLNKPDPTRVQVRFQVINFGDGTGFMGIDGVSVPQPAKSSRVEPKGRGDGGQVISTFQPIPPSKKSRTKMFNHFSKKSAAKPWRRG
jgi:hypothetical protein